MRFTFTIIRRTTCSATGAATKVNVYEAWCNELPRAWTFVSGKAAEDVYTACLSHTTRFVNEGVDGRKVLAIREVILEEATPSREVGDPPP